MGRTLKMWAGVRAGEDTDVPCHARVMRSLQIVRGIADVGYVVDARRAGHLHGMKDQVWCGPAAPYVVVSGDTPETIATRHGVTVEELLAANGWSQKDRVLYEGDKIQIPARHTT